MTGAGPSRRSHTKSRTGCKTCKKRHIRCDETFPQCRNCTKHQVRCDYMDAIGNDHVPSASPESEPVVLSSTPYVEASIDQWTRTGTFPFANLQEVSSPALYDLSRNDLRLLHHICTVANDLQSSGTDQLTVWAQKMPRFLSLASTFPFVMHAILSFSANHLSWAQSSSAIRSLQVQHGGIALRGLHNAISAFSSTNADAILAASMLMCWQSTDWLSYSSLTAGMQSVMQAMQSWRHESALLNMFSDFPGIRTAETPNRGPVSMNERVNILNNIIDALQRLQLSLIGNDMELHWVGQLLAYVYRIQNSPPAQTPEEHLEHTYLLRKWVFWVPVSLLQRGTNRGPALLVLAHLYATAIAFSELFPGVNHRYSSVMALQPLETIISMTEAMQFEQNNNSTLEIRNLMHFARQTAWNYRETHIESQASPASSFQSFQHEVYHSANNMSPAFTPAPPDPSITAEFLAAPMHLGEGFTHGVSNWGAMPSPGFPPLQGDIASIDSSDDFRGLHGGFVNPLPIWT